MCTACRFRVKFEAIKPEKLEASTTVKGMEYIDVPASGKKDYKLLFFAHKEGVTIMKVCTNEIFDMTNKMAMF